MNYLKTLDLIYQESSFVPDKIIKAYAGSSFFVIGKYRGETAILRTSPLDDKDKLEKLSRESEASRIINDYIKHKSDKISFNAILASGQKNDLAYSIRKYQDIPTLSPDNEDNTSILHGLDLIRNTFLDRDKIILKSIINNINNLQKIDVDFAKSFKNRFKFELQDKDIELIKKYLSIDLTSQQKFYLANSKNYCSESNLKICMGDLIPPNILVDRNFDITLFDFEWFCADNYMLDLSFFWLFLWRYPNWQQNLLLNIAVTDQDKLFFQMSVIRILISWYGEALLSSTGLELNKKVEFYKKHIWLDYLKVSGQSNNLILKFNS